MNPILYKTASQELESKRHGVKYQTIAIDRILHAKPDERKNLSITIETRIENSEFGGQARVDYWPTTFDSISVIEMLQTIRHAYDLKLKELDKALLELEQLNNQ